jgi:hypothetical protein
MSDLRQSLPALDEWRQGCFCVLRRNTPEEPFVIAQIVSPLNSVEEQYASAWRLAHARPGDAVVGHRDGPVVRIWTSVEGPKSAEFDLRDAAQITADIPADDEDDAPDPAILELVARHVYAGFAASTGAVAPRRGIADQAFAWAEEFVRAAKRRTK